MSDARNLFIPNQTLLSGKEKYVWLGKGAYEKIKRRNVMFLLLEKGNLIIADRVLEKIRSQL